ncbi:TetR/AcrR family transcriptional regulator [Microbacteriaceae bacterium K1510]|nr:TetR/AcrR family transcriptional regulator [Microbacteriaceae bacterium K1510]
MRRANAQLQSDRRNEILDAAARCFARSGFHQTSMQTICAEAGMSPGNVYRYFRSKEAIIAAISERDLAQAAADFEAVDKAPDFFTGFAALGRRYLVERDREEIALCLDIWAEARRNPEIRHIHESIQSDVRAGLAAILRRAADRGELRRDLDFDKIVTVIIALGDGLESRRAIDPSFNPESVIDIVLDLVRYTLTDCKLARAGTEENSDEG